MWREMLQYISHMYHAAAAAELVYIMTDVHICR